MDRATEKAVEVAQDRTRRLHNEQVKREEEEYRKASEAMTKLLVTVIGSPWDRVHAARLSKAPGYVVLLCSGWSTSNWFSGSGPTEGRSVWCSKCFAKYVR